MMNDDTEHRNTDEQGDVSLSSQTIALRRAFQDCSDGIERLRRAHNDGMSLLSHGNISELVQYTRAAAEMNQKLRREGSRDVSRRVDMVEKGNRLPIDVITVADSDSYSREGSETMMKPYEFKQSYCVRNVPCIIRGLAATHFPYVSSQWRSNNHVNVEWFREFVGDDNMVPVRVEAANNNQNNGGLDDDGRAMECETVELKLSEWVQYSNGASYDQTKLLDSSSPGYLKDWHLLQHFNDDKQFPILYAVPSIFEKDLLNNFLSRYVGGDYKFVYWGPAGSRTQLHSDVLNSFSWSYNVVGRKHWTFYIPDCDEDAQTKDVKTFELIQEMGETVFVPAMWKHEVVNLVETLSINHNWITSANVDCTYEVLLTEIFSIEQEIRKWEIISKDDYEARENMLRGCVGLDVSTFVVMILFELIELLALLCTVDNNYNTRIDMGVRDEDFLLDWLYSIYRLRNMLKRVLYDDSKVTDVRQRLKATLCSENIVSKVTAYSEFCLELIESLESK
jgi:hypothetical protein